MNKVKIAVIGGGAAGMMAAGYAAELNADVTLFEKNRSLGKKLSITGKGRCNVTNNCQLPEVIANIPTNPRFMYSALNNFSPADTMEFFENLGVPLKTERGGRVFPVSDKSSDIVNALRSYVIKGGGRIVNDRVTSLALCAEDESRICGLTAGDKSYLFDRVIIATGGASYPLTGSDGDGYRFACSLGISVSKISASLVPLESVEQYCSELQGLSLRNVGVKITDIKSQKTVYEDFGELLFTHFGVSGPTVLSASSHLRDITPDKYRFSIDLKPALDTAALDRRLLSDFLKYNNKNYANALCDMLPSKLIDVFVRLSGIPAERKVNSITKDERSSIIYLLKNFSFTVKKLRPIAEAIITSGGIAVNEINPKTMESKKIKGLYFAGEVIDVDAYTGGFNLQIAFSTARLAAKAASL